MIVPRTRLLGRLIACEPRLVKLLAPAGYGKSTLARFYAKQFERHGICDCSAVRDTADFAARVMSALADESHDSDDALAAMRLHLHVTDADAATWTRALLDVWKRRGECALLVLEHADGLVHESSVLALLGDMLAARPPERVLLVASSTDLPLRISHYVAPHQALTISRDDLRFEREEARAIFDQMDLAPEIVERIVTLARGWPIVLLLLARFADYEPNIEQLLDQLDDVDFEQLHEHLSNEVIASLTPDMTSTLLATAAIPHASLEDISAASGLRHAAPIIDGLLRLPGFMSSEPGGRYRTHPLVLGPLRAKHEREFAGYLLRAAAENERSGNFLRAAELHHLSGNTPAAAAALNRLAASALEFPASRLIDALTRISTPILCGFPNLWVALLCYRIRHVDAARLYDEATALLHAGGPESSPALRRRLRVRVAMLAERLDRLSEAQATLKTVGPVGTLDEAPDERRLILMTLVNIAAKRGCFEAADRLVEEADAVQSARHVRFDRERELLAMARARMLGDWHELLRQSEETLAAARRSGDTARIIDAARVVADAAWYCNDDARAGAMVQMLADCGASVVPVRWHSALQLSDGEAAARTFEQAIAEVDAVENDFLRIVIRVAAALLLPAQRHRLLEAREIAEHIESPPLQASLELLIDTPAPSDFGIFHYLAARVAHSPLKVLREGLFVDVVRGQVRRGDEVLRVSDRGLELLIALALLPAGTSKEELATAIWPELDAEDALNTLKMCVHRTRAQLADKDAIRSTKRGYSLSERVAVDVRELERLLRGVRGAEALPESVRRQIQEAIRTLDAHHQRTYAADWDWFAAYPAQLDELHHELMLVLAKDAFRRDDPQAVYELAERLIKLDRCDETAYALMIEERMKHGDRVAAMREYQRYVSALEHDLNLTPSEHLRALMGRSTN